MLKIQGQKPPVSPIEISFKIPTTLFLTWVFHWTIYQHEMKICKRRCNCNENEIPYDDDSYTLAIDQKEKSGPSASLSYFQKSFVNIGAQIAFKWSGQMKIIEQSSCSIYYPHNSFAWIACVIFPVDYIPSPTQCSLYCSIVCT